MLHQIGYHLKGLVAHHQAILVKLTGDIIPLVSKDALHLREPEGPRAA